MKFENYVKKVEKRLGVKVHIEENRCWFQYGDRVGSFRRQEKWDKPGVYEACSFHSRQENDHTDLMTDYFAGTYWDNGSQLLNSMKPPEPKFSVGALVRGKQNKRAIRQGYAGKVGLVVDAGTYMQIKWCGEPENSERYYTPTYPERDIELVSAA